MPVNNYKLFLKIMLLSGFFAINNLTVVAMQKPKATSENAAVDEVVNNLKQENDSTIENSKIIEDNKPVNLEPIATAQNQEVTTNTADTEASANINPTDSKDEDTKPVNDEIASTQANKDTNNEQASDKNQQDNKILIKNSYISINPGANAGV